MQTTMPTELPQNLPENWTGMPYWIQLVVGFLLIGVGASILASQLRAAFPPPEQPGDRRQLHRLYAPVFGMMIGLLSPFFLPGFGLESRWLLGLVAPFLWSPLYDILKKRYLSQMGIEAPAAKDLINPKGE